MIALIRVAFGSILHLVAVRFVHNTEPVLLRKNREFKSA